MLATRGVKIRLLAYRPDFIKAPLLGAPSPSATSATWHPNSTIKKPAVAEPFTESPCREYNRFVTGFSEARG